MICTPRPCSNTPATSSTNWDPRWSWAAPLCARSIREDSLHCWRSGKASVRTSHGIPGTRRLFGPVSISNQYQAVSRELMVTFLERHASLARMGEPDIQPQSIQAAISQAFAARQRVRPRGSLRLRLGSGTNAHRCPGPAPAISETGRQAARIQSRSGILGRLGWIDCRGPHEDRTEASRTVSRKSRGPGISQTSERDPK